MTCLYHSNCFNVVNFLVCLIIFSLIRNLGPVPKNMYTYCHKITWPNSFTLWIVWIQSKRLFRLAMLEFILVTFAQSFMYSDRWIFCAIANTFLLYSYRAVPCTPVQTADAHIEVSDQTPSGCRGCWECVAGAGSLWLPPSPWSLFQPSPGSICHPLISQVWHRTSQTRRIYWGHEHKWFDSNIT